MSAWEVELRTRYKQVGVPAPIRTMDAIDARVADATEDFFRQLAGAFQLSQLALSVLMKVDTRMLVPPFSPSAMHSADTLRASDDYLEQLSIEGAQTLASVLRTRDERNFQIAHFAKYALLPGSIEILAELEHLEGRIA